MHSLLNRQIRRSLPADLASNVDLQPFLHAVEAAYEAFDNDRTLLERSLELSSRELLQANAQMHAVFQAMPDILLSVDGTGRILDHKGGATKPIGRMNLRGMDMRSLMAAESGAEFDAALRQVFDRGDVVSLGTPLSCRDSGCLFDVKLAPLADDRAIVMLHDMSERRRAEQTLRQSEERYRALFVTNPHPMWVYDLATLHFLDVNEAAVRHYGYARDEFLAMRTTDVEMGVEVPEPGSGHPVTPTPVVHRARDGRVMDVELTVHDLQFGATTARLVVATDVSERRRVEALQLAKEAAEQASRAKSLFLANMSHELRTPLNAIIGYSEMLQDEFTESEPDVVRRDLQRIESAGRHLLALISDVLDLSKIEAGRMEVSSALFSVADLVSEVTSTVQLLARAHGNVLTSTVASGLGDMQGDSVKVRQVLFNLLSNACKFTRDGEVALEAVREGEGDRAMLVVRVRDTGIGITEAQQAVLFQDFSQGDASTTRRFGGTGLGLSISRRLCGMMGGSIALDSRPGEGSCFTVRLPLAGAVPVFRDQAQEAVAVPTP
ncbi:MAG: PAS domain-containing sensor histidine kinase [Vicinamibacterales bacterium]